MFLTIMNNWTTQPGYPVLYVTLQNDHMKLRQDRFFLNPDDRSPQTIWYIPISWTNLNNPNFTDTKPKLWFNVTQDSIQLPSKHLYLLNVQQSGEWKWTMQNICKFLLQTYKISRIYFCKRIILWEQLFLRVNY